jgi:hypothetical protein
MSQWITVYYQPVSLFSLKRSDATSMAGRSNLVPTPYAVKMALLKVLLESEGKLHLEDFHPWIEGEFSWIRDLTIYIQPPEQLVVNRNGYKLRYYDQTTDKAEKTRVTLPLQPGYVFREWIHLQGTLAFCCGVTTKVQRLTELFAQINYFGKRSGFFQYLPDSTQYTEQPLFTYQLGAGFILQPLDDLGEKTTFDKINPFSPKPAKLGKDRVINQGLLPLSLVATGANYDYYRRSSD